MALILAGAMSSAACGTSSTPEAAAATPHTSTARSDAEIRDLDIAYFAARAERDPTGGADLARLGALYLARSRATGDPRDITLAEEVARRSLRNRPERNGPASRVLQASLLAQHRFDEALRIATGALENEPENAALRAAVGEIQMELGQYDSARLSFNAVKASLGDPAVAPRLARWAEIQGQPEKARRLLRAALATVQKLPEVPREQVAWYWLRIGDVELRTGHYAVADAAYNSGLAINPDDYRLLSALAQSALMQYRHRDAIAFGERAIAVTLDPGTLGTLSDAYAAIGDTARSAEYAKVLDVVVLKQPGAYHRAWTLFLLENGRHTRTVSRKIREEMQTRKDIYAYDLLAWSLHKQGRHAEARAAMTVALSQGTKDVQLRRHAAAIEAAP